MARSTNRLSAAALKNLGPGMHPDGGGLYFQVKNGGRSWLLRYMLHRRARAMGLGPWPDVSLRDAREAAEECRKQLRQGIDPIEAREAERIEAMLEAAQEVSFKDAADRYIKAHRASWSNEKHAKQWESTLETYAYPTFGKLPVASVDTGLVLKALEPVWTQKPETASRVRQRIEAILDWATARGYRQGENPARWRGHLDKLLPKPSRVKQAGHHAALPYDDMAEFMADLRQQPGTAARGLEFLILTATRTGEVIGATWDEIDLSAKTWTIPAERTKTKAEHRVPLSEPALAILGKRAGEGFLFPGAKPGKPLSNMAFLALLRRMERDDVTAHGFRSTFRDWSAEQTAYPREVCEMALGHAISNKVEAAYRRGDLFEKRRRLMRDWGRFCGQPATKGQKVVSLQGA